MVELVEDADFYVDPSVQMQIEALVEAINADLESIPSEMFLVSIDYFPCDMQLEIIVEDIVTSDLIEFPEDRNVVELDQYIEGEHLNTSALVYKLRTTIDKLFDDIATDCRETINSAADYSIAVLGREWGDIDISLVVLNMIEEG
jgi:hypothetical protein